MAARLEPPAASPEGAAEATRGPVLVRVASRFGLDLPVNLVVDLTMLALAVVSIALVFYEVVAEANLTAQERLILDVVDLAIVLVFLTEFVISARRSGNTGAYVRRNWYDLPSMIWIPGTLLQGLVSLRLLRLVRLVRVMRAAARLRRLSTRTRYSALQERVLYIAIVAVATILFGALSAFVLEHGVNPDFAGIDDALWWSVVTTATVGYGDVVPITLEGRLVAILLMTIGVGIIGTFAGSIAQSLFKRGDRARKRIYSRWHQNGD